MSTILLLVFIMILGILFIYIFPSSHKSGNSIVTWDMAINGSAKSYSPNTISVQEIRKYIQNKNTDFGVNLVWRE